jgi:protein required for attachment to host cells
MLGSVRKDITNVIGDAITNEIEDDEAIQKLIINEFITHMKRK